MPVKGGIWIIATMIVLIHSEIIASRCAYYYILDCRLVHDGTWLFGSPTWAERGSKRKHLNLALLLNEPGTLGMVHQCVLRIIAP